MSLSSAIVYFSDFLLPPPPFSGDIALLKLPVDMTELNLDGCSQLAGDLDKLVLSKYMESVSLNGCSLTGTIELNMVTRFSRISSFVPHFLLPFPHTVHFPFSPPYHSTLPAPPISRTPTA